MRISVHGSRPGIPNPRPLTSGLHSLRVHGSCSIRSPYSQHILWDKSSHARLLPAAVKKMPVAAAAIIVLIFMFFNLLF